MKDFLLKIFGLIFKNFVHIVAGVLILIVAGLGYRVYSDSKIKQTQHDDLVGQQQAYAQLSASTAILASDYKTQKQLDAAAAVAWAKERAELKGQIVALANATFSDPGSTTTTTPINATVEVSYADGPPVGSVELLTTGLAVSRLYAHDFQVQAIATSDPKTGRYKVAVKGFYVLRDPNALPGSQHWIGQSYPLKITGGDFQIDPVTPTPGFIPNTFTWAQHLNVGVFAGATNLGALTAGGHLDATFAGYGKTRNDLDFKFLGVGFNANRDYLDFNVVPVYWRLPIPLLSNAYIGPGAGFGSKGANYFLTVGATL